MRRRRIALRVALCLAAVLPVSSPAPAWSQQPTAADLETARNLNREGKDLRAKGDLQGALSKFRAAHELGRTPVTGLELARTHVMASQLVEAREVCLGIARIPVAADETDKSASAREEASKLAEELRPRIPAVIVKLAGVPPGKTPTLLVDRMQVPVMQIGEPRKVNPGTHEIAARVGRGPEVTTVLELREGQTQEVQLQVPPEPEPPPGSPPPVAVAPAPGAATPAPPRYERSVERERHPNYGLATAGFTVALLGGLVGVTTGLVAIDRKHDLEKKCTERPDGGFDCGPLHHDALRDAKTIATVSTVSLVIGGVGLVGGIVGLVSTTDARKSTARVSPWIGAGSAGVRGSF